ncbi:MAG: hypothetical protein LBS88_13435 [Tannerellaceae bacterium]|nr:hypothetical protein [Tannerellaceae bacterium]
MGKEAGISASDVSEDTNLALSPAIAAEIIIRAMEQGRKRLYIGKDSKTMNLLYKFKPDFATKMIYRKITHRL